MSSILSKYKKKEHKEDTSNNRHNLMVKNQPTSQYEELPRLVISDRSHEDDTQTPTLERKNLPLSIGDGSLSLDEFNLQKSQSNGSLKSFNVRKRMNSDSKVLTNKSNSTSGTSTPDKLPFSHSTRNSIDGSHNSINTFDNQIGLGLDDKFSPDIDTGSLELGDYFGDGITGFAVASSRRNSDFHELFPNIPDQDYLIEDYGCALQREILIQGRIYISENHICFNANIFGWVTSFAVPFSEMVSIEKKMTAFVIPNAIQISTLRAKYVFASFLSRDTVYDVILNIWRLSHPTVPVSEDYHESAHLANQSSSQGDSDTSTASSITSSFSKSSKKRKSRSDKHSKSSRKQSSRKPLPRQPTQRNPPTIHRATKIDPSVHFPDVAMDTTLPATPEKLYNLMFTSFFIKDFMTSQDLTEIQISDWQPKADSSRLARTITYIKPLSVGVGPKSTKCVLDDENEHVDFDDHVLVLTSTRTPEVPSGNSFIVRTRTAISWAVNNSSHVTVTTKVDWTGRSFLKGVIERSAIEGQKSYHRALESAMRKYIEEHANEFSDTNLISQETVEREREGSSQLAEAAKMKEEEMKQSIQNNTSLLSTFLQHLLDGSFELFNRIIRLVTTIFSALGALTISPSFTNSLYVLIFVLVISNAYTYFILTPYKSTSTLGKHNEPLIVDTIRSVVNDAFKHHTHSQSDAQIEIDQLNVALDRISNRLETLKQSM
ncbi:hypothetical protein E3Q17_03257 [Wallemia mellicola]|uniref:VASt domain-containing protein n=1 Tax=Wallemia mellicola TaxID=1708541 RepID=A0A4V4MLN3_9BASI|nr:hypothetical protein E3Q17_03257 [Wallemia mellicola]